MAIAIRRSVESDAFDYAVGAGVARAAAALHVQDQLRRIDGRCHEMRSMAYDRRWRETHCRLRANDYLWIPHLMSLFPLRVADVVSIMSWSVGASRRGIQSLWMRRFATVALTLVLSLGAASYSSPASACRYSSQTSNLECMAQRQGPWIYDPQSYYGDVPGVYDTYEEAVSAALANIPVYWGAAFCSYNWQNNNVPWVTLTWNWGRPSGQRKTNEITGLLTLVQGGSCNYQQGQGIDIARTTDFPCPAGWSPQVDSAGNPQCVRPEIAPPPPQCERPCLSGTPKSGGVGSTEAGYVGNPIYAHTGEKIQTEVDWSSGGYRPLTLSRTYVSRGFPYLPGTAYKEFGLGYYWRTNFDRRLQTYVGTTVTSKVAYRPDGSARYFYQSGSTWSGRAEQSDRLVNRTDGSGAVIGWRLTNPDDSYEDYDLQERVVAIVYPGGWRQDISYNANDQVASVVDSLGRALTFTYSGSGRLLQVTTPDGVVGFTINARGYLKSVTFADGSQRQYLTLESGLAPTNTSVGYLTGVIDENGSRYATYKYNSAGVAWSTEHGAGAEKYTLSIGSTTVVTDPLGTARTLAKATVAGFVRSTGYSQACPACGSNGNVSTSTMDAIGNVTSRTYFTGKKTCYAYDATRNLETARLEGATSAENCTTVLATPPNRPDVRKIATTWHSTWRLPATITEPAPGGTKTTTFTYDGSGSLTQKSITAPKNDGSGATITRTWNWTYGTLGRVLTATDPNGKVTTTTYHSDTDPDLGKRGQVATVTNPLGHLTQYTAYDAGNRLTSMTDPNGLVTAMAYDARGRMTSRNVGGEVTTYTYDLAGQLTGVQMPDAATLTYVYDAAHRLTEVHDGLGNKVVYTLDGMGNRTAENAYDPAAVLARTRTRVYDSLNRLAQEVGAQSQATVMTYDGNGNRLTSTDPLNHATTSTYDALNRLLTVTQPGGPLTQYAYDKANNLVTVTDPREPRHDLRLRRARQPGHARLARHRHHDAHLRCRGQRADLDRFARGAFDLHLRQRQPRHAGRLHHGRLPDRDPRLHLGHRSQCQGSH